METKNLNTKYCVGLGEILFDVLPTGSQLGGAPANFAYHAGQHGLHSVAVSAVGKDVLGNIITGAIIPLVPGVPFTNGIRDLANEDYIAGATRLLDALMVFLCIAAGVSFA